MKKLTALILTAVMLVCMTAIVPVSADANTVEITPVEAAVNAEAGKNVDIFWDANTDLAFFNMRFRIEFDDSVFTFIDYDETEEYGSFVLDGMRSFSYQWSVSDDAVNCLAKSNKTSNAVVGSRQFLNTWFAVAEDAPTGDYEIKFVNIEASNYDSQNLSVADLPSVTVHVEGKKPEGPIVVDGLKTVGGQVRVPVNGVEPDKFGFRFVSTMDATVEAVEYGTLVIPTDLLDGADLVAGNATAEMVVATKVMSEENDVVTFNATMVEIKDANLKRNFTSRAYAKLADGSYVYGAAYETNIYNIAKAAVDAGEAVEYLTTNVLDKAK